MNITPLAIGSGNVLGIASSRSGAIAYFSDTTGKQLGQLAQLSPGHLLANAGASSADAAETDLSDLMDRAFGSTRGSLVFRGVSGWVLRTPGTAGYALISSGSGADPNWGQVSGGSISSAGSSNGNPTLPNAFDPAATGAGLTLTNDNLTVNGSPSGDKYTRTLYATQSNAFYYYELTVNINPTSSDSGFGFANGSATGPGLGSDATNGIIIFRFGSLYINGTDTGNTPLGGAIGSRTYGCVIRTDVGRVWFRDITNNRAWNNDVTADPASNAGGFSYGSLAGPFYPVVVVSDNNFKVTANFGSSTFAGTPPTGATTSWGVSSGGSLGGITAGDGLTIDSSGVLRVQYGTGPATAVQGNDARLVALQTGQSRAVIAAAGSTQGTATALTARVNFVTSGSGGVILPNPATLFAVDVFNRSGSSITIYPNSGGKIEAGSTDAGVTLANGSRVMLAASTATQWYQG